MKEGRKELEEEQERIQNLIAKEKEQAKHENSRHPCHENRAPANNTVHILRKWVGLQKL